MYQLFFNLASEIVHLTISHAYI